ncbi:hypothetical protein PF003_g20665 [Phytophthora fragariae]|nr:hypothetical protein PF003_g20665 [Phytophthora fragariae]
MESAAPSRSGGRKRRGGGKRKRSGGRNSENEERKTQDPPAQQQEAEEEKGEKEKEDKNKKEKEEKEEEDKEEKPPTHWSCEACTFLNEASRCFCEMCETPNPSPPAASARALTGASEWSCAACTMVNPAAMRVCGVCGTLNPRPPAGLSIVRLSQALGDESLSSASSDDSDEDDSDDSDDEEEEDDEAEDTWICRNCDALAAGRTCSNCFAQRPKIARKSAKAAELEKKSKEERKQALMKKRKRRKREKKLQERARMAYGVSIYELKKLVLEPTSSRLVDTLQTLTHTLAMMDASADNEWGDGPSFLMRGFGAGPSSDTAKDPELLTVLADIFRGKERTYPVEVRQLAVQAISYLMRMDRHMFARSKMVEVVGLYITDLLAWKKDGTSDVSSGNAKSAQMIVEECLSGLSSMCSTEAFALRELLADGHFVGYLDFLTRLVDGDEEKDGGFHPSILMTALGILQKGCMKLRWGGKPGQRRGSHGNVNVEKPSVSRAASPKKVTQESQLTLELAVKLVSFLRHVLEHKHIPLHVKASKCLLLLFHRAPHNRPEVMEKLVTPDVLRKFVAVVVNANNESEESRLAMVSLLLHLFENRARLVNMFVREKIYAELFSGMLPLLQSSSTALRAHALKLTAMLARVVCRKHSLGFSNSSCHKSMDESSVNGSAVCSPQNRHNRHRLNSLPDPDVLSKLLLDFIRADSIPAVNVLLKDGADLNFPKMLDLQGNEIDKPLNVAVQCASLGMVRLLLKRGADIHQVGIGGTALHVAAKTGRCDVATFLLQCGARVQARDRENKTVMNVINSLKDYALSGDGAGRVPSPMAKLLELHQRAPGMRDYESDLSESDGMSGGRSQAWFYPSDHDDEYGDEDEMDDDDLEGEENYYMNYNDDEDEGVDEDMGDESMSSDGDMVYYDDEMSSEVAPSRQHRHGSTASGSETKFENAGQDTGESNMTLTRRGRTSSGEKDLQGDNTELEQKGFTLTPEEAYDFCFAITQCLLAVLHDMDIQNVERSVISTVACVLEMAPSRLIRVLKEVDVVLILDTVHFLLQGEKHRLSSSDPTSMEVTAATPTSLTSATDTTRTGTAPTAPNSNLPSFILAVRILQAMIRKSAKESSIFHQIERRGISEQIEQLNDASACWISTSFGEGSSNSRDTIFGRGLDLLKSLRADMLESGMLHLHKLRNLARRLKEFTDSSSSYEKDLILVDLVDLFEQPNSITTYEFKQSELLPAILQYLSPQGELDEARALALMRAFERCPSALKNLIFRLQSIITQEETFPLVSFNTGKGKELFPLTRQLKIAFMRPGDRNAGARPHRGTAGRPKGKSIHSSPLTHFQSFERTIARCMPVIDSDLSSLYLNLVGHSIQKVVEGKWRKFLVVGYDDTRSHHLVKPIGGSNDDLAEMVIHDSQCKLIGNVDVYESISLDLALFGSPDTVDNGGSSQDNKKKRKPNKRKRKSSAGSLQQNRLGGGQRPSSSAMDHLRNLISRSSAFNGSNGSNDVDTPSEQAPRIAQDSGSNSPPNDLIGSEAQAEEETPAPALSASTKAAGQHKSPTNGSSCETPALQTYLKPVGAKPKLTCTQLPKVNLVVGFRKCDASTAAQDRIIVSSEFGLQRLGRSKINNDMPQAPLLIQLNRSTQRFEATPGARKALLNVFNTFSGNTGSGSSQKKKRRKLSPVAQRKTDLEGTPWDIDKFIAFMMILRGPAKYGHPGSNAKYCVVFSKFADPDTNRSLLKADGFISLMVHECKDDAKSKQLLKFLRSRGYSEKSLTYSVSRSSSRDDDEEKDSPSGSDSGGAKAASTSGNNTLRQPGVLRGFPGDQNVLKCVEDLRQEYRARAGGNNGLSSDTISSVDATLPPWKLTYKLYCDFQVEWETQPPSNPNTTIADAESLESLAALESKTPTRLLSHGIVALDCLHANGATDASRWLSRITDSQAGSRDGIAVPKSVASAVRLLRYLFEFRADSTSLDESLWASPRLYNKLETQMQDVLSMCSGIYPPWCDTLVTHCKFFFPRELREKLFRSTSFGCTRSLHWFRSQLNIEESSADSTSSMVGGGLYNQEISISPIPKERVKVHRENILQSAEAVMKMHAKRKAILDVVFVGEKGYGSGVTAAFYSTTAHALQSVVENQTNRYWIPGEDDEADAVKAAARRVNGADDFDSIADDAAVIRHSNAGKALMDERLLPLPLSPQFMKLVVGETFGSEELSDIFLSHGRILHSMYKASKRLAEGEWDVQIDQMNVEDWLDAVGLTFIDPLSQEPLVAGGEDITVTASNLTLYVRAVLELWLESGIHAQVLAFRDGIGEVLPIGKLRLLFVPELLSLLCGEKDIEWDVASLLKDTKLAHGYTKDSEPVQYFFEVLDEMASAERRAFLLYATGCPNLPLGGFQALKPPFEVVRRVVDNVEVDRALPFARTCTNTLHLPAYSSKALLAKQLAFAVANSRGVIDRD